ncbi:sulfite exporter TauE/SafE family protein [Thiothrix nivea]|uniref:Probable membrane transporter protein n=1 Tax=Thiothrix nivea (strain ATCC 35100 / DSM 5205 / JP2) TaxID=870187 RepID=A0A656HB77_THINJ|nr:sulfite exporter TauE/SafE family protein [Thiothrix nivea]EIJ34068.1 protein of unknown function DUF81 [Thiothrix nivea DSM 5205]
MELESIALLLGWGLLVGVVFSIIGAAGGILASFGLMTLVGVTDPNAVKPMAQIMTLVMVMTFLPLYWQRAACVPSMGLLLSVGSVAGAWLGSSFSSQYLHDMQVFRPLFGVLAVLIAVQIFWKVLFRPSAAKQPVVSQGVHGFSLRKGHLDFSHGTRAFHIAVWHPLLAGFLIAMVAAMFGVGGGFLLVPFMASLLGMPMYIVPATAAIPILIGCSVSVANYLRLGAEPDYGVLVLLAIGGVVGAIIGPRLNRLARERWLQALLGVVITGIGVKYVLV